MKHKRRFSFASALTALALIVPQSLSAQAPATPQRWSVITITTIKPEARMEYEALQKQVTAAYRKAEIPSRALLQTVLGNLYEYVSISPITKFADMDGASPLERGLGKEGAAALASKIAACATSMHRMLSRELPDLSINTQTSEPPALAMVTSIHLAPGRAQDFAAWVKSDYLPAAKKAEVKNLWISGPVHGGDPEERIVVMPLKAMADFDAGPFLTRALGPEGAQKVTAKTAGIVESRSYRVVRYRTDLSYRMPPARNAGGQ